MSIYVGRDMERGNLHIHYITGRLSASMTLSESEAIDLADELVAQVDALNVGKVLDEC